MTAQSTVLGTANMGFVRVTMDEATEDERAFVHIEEPTLDGYTRRITLNGEEARGVMEFLAEFLRRVQE